MAGRVGGSYRPTRPNRPNRGRRTLAPAQAVVEQEINTPSVDGQKAADHKVTIPASISVKDLAGLLDTTGVQVIKELMRNGIMASINQVVDYDTAAIVAVDLGFEPQETPREKKAPAAVAELPRSLRYQENDQSALRPRPPIVTIMGHVDHGKTSLLDAIRQTNVIATEAGGITQHIGAYQAEIHGQKITFLDTPGHEAFTAMRARGAKVTDIAVLVVAADDGIMPQTVEAIDHARAAGVPIIVAINKIDKPNANPERVKQGLSDLGLVVEEWGGDVIAVPVSAKRKEGISDLLENILVVAELAELKANPNRSPQGAVIEAEMDKTKGPLATVLVETGTLKLGDAVIAGESFGRLKAMFNDKGKRIKKAEPSTPVQILGLNAVPTAGDTFEVVTDEKAARAAIEARRLSREREALGPHRAVSLQDVFEQIKEGKIKELNLILKTDVQGSIEPIKNSLEKIQADTVKAKVIHQGSGSITESDVLLAVASKGIILGFNTTVEPGAKRLAEQEDVDIRLYSVIYNLVDDVKKALSGMLEPVIVEVVQGHAEVRNVFKFGRHEAVAGSYVTDGVITRNDLARVLRKGEVIFDSRIGSLKRFKDDVREVSAGFECGIGIENFSNFEVGDIIQSYRKEKGSRPAI